MKRVLLFLCLYACQVSAQDKKDTSLLEPVEVRATRAAATAPFAKTNLDRKVLEKQNLGQDLPFLLNNTPSVVVNSDAGNGVGYTGIRIRGSDATRINVTVNGIPYNDAESGSVYFVDLPDIASSLGSIQIQRGVGTSTNGPGAFGATINLSTNEVNRKAYAEINNSLGSFHTWKHTIRAGTGLLGHHFTTDVRLSKISSDGYVDRASSDLRSLYFSTAYLADKTDLRFNIISGKEKTYQSWYGVTADDLLHDRRHNYAGTEKPGTPYENETDNYLQTHYQLFFTQRIRPHLSFHTALFLTRGKGYYEEYRAAQQYLAYGLPEPVVGPDTIHTTDLVRQLWLDNYYYGGTFSLQEQWSSSQLILGGAATRYDGRHFGKLVWAEKGLNGQPQWYDLDARKADQNFYAKWQQDLSADWQLFADLQYRHVQYALDGFKDNPTLFINRSYHFFNPKAGFSYHHKNLLAYASFSVGNKEPNRDDFEAGLQQLPRPEHLNDLEIGLENKKEKGSWSVNVFYMRYKNQLVLTGKINDVGAYTRTNIPSSYRAGIELEGSITLSTWAKAGANLALSRNRVKNFTEYIDDYDNGGQKQNAYGETDISFSPNVVGAATLSFTPLNSLGLDLMSKYVSRQFLDNTENRERSLRPYFTEDARASYSFGKGWLKRVDLVFVVNNIFNKKYEPNGYTYSYYANGARTSENYYFPMAGRNFMAAVNIKLW